MASVVDIGDISEDALNLKYMMDGILERVEAIYQSYNVPLPQRRYWVMGTPAIDCEQVVVAFNQMYLGTPGAQINEPQRCNVPRTAIVTISVARPIPTAGMNGRAPTAEKIQQGSEMSAIDSWVLMSSMKLFDTWDNGAYGLGMLATLEAGDMEGGFQVVSLELTMAVP
jgi:hypothetical protein